MRRRWILLSIVIATPLLIWGAAIFLDHRQGEQKMERLLKGDSSVAIREIVIHGPTESIRCTERATLDYIAAAMRHPTSATHGGLWSNATFRFQGGGTFDTEVTAYPAGFSVSLPSQALESGFPTHDILIPANAPPGVRQMMNYLTRTPY